MERMIKLLLPLTLILFLTSCRDKELTRKMNEVKVEIKEKEIHISSLRNEIHAPIRQDKKPDLNKSLKVLKQKEREVNLLQESLEEKQAVYDELSAHFQEFKEGHRRINSSSE